MEKRETKTGERFQELFEKLKSFNLPSGQFAVMGSGPLAVRGLREPHDLDIVVSDKLWEELSQKYPVVEGWHSGKIKLTEDIDAFTRTAADIPVEELIARADIFDGVRFVSLEDTIAAKRVQNREKDLADIELIEKYLEKASTVK